MIRCLTFLLVFAILPTPVRAQGSGTVEIEEFQPNPNAQTPPPAEPAGVARFNLRFTGVTAFSEDELRTVLAEQIGGIQSAGLTAAAADDTAFFLAVHYRKQGYSQVEVREEIAGAGTLILHVTEGAITEIAETRFIGNASIEAEKLKEYLLGATRERLSRFDKTIPYIEGDILTGVERIRGLYLSEGFLDSEVAKPEIDLSADTTQATVTVRIDEGTRYTIGNIDVTGDVVFFRRGATGGGAQISEDLEKQLRAYTGKPFTPAQIINLRRTVVYSYKTRGYYDTRVEAEADPARAVDGVVPVFFHVDSGSVYQFDGIEVSGLDRLREGFLQNRFGRLTGKIYSPDKLNEVFRRMMRTGLFTRLQVDTESLPTREVKIKLQVEEARAKELGFALGYGTFEGPFVGVSAAERDLFGTGRPIEARAEFAQRFYKGEALFRDPWFLESDYELRVRAFGLSSSFNGYDKFELGGRIELAKQLTPKTEVVGFVLGRNVGVTNLGIDPAEIGPTTYMANSVGASITFDMRDSLLNPRKGWILGASADYATAAIGSDLDFFRATYRFSYYLPIKRTLLALGARGGFIEPLGSLERLPIDERFFNGGSRSVRSFAERELGPTDMNGFFIGGQTFSVYNIEFVFPIFGDLEGAVFVDAGSVGRRTGDGLGDLRYGIGGGLRYKLPVGPLRLDYGWNPSPRDEEAAGAFHFSFGVAF